MNGPWSFDEALERCRDASRRQEDAENELRLAYQRSATSEENYRKALAVQILAEHEAGVAWSVAADVARGRDAVARLRRERDIADGVREAQMQVAWRRTADRKDAQRFADWSQRRELAGIDTPLHAEFDRPVGARG